LTQFIVVLLTQFIVVLLTQFIVVLLTREASDVVAVLVVVAGGTSVW